MINRNLYIEDSLNNCLLQVPEQQKGPKKENNLSLCWRRHIYSFSLEKVEWSNSDHFYIGVTQVFSEKLFSACGSDINPDP